MELKFADCEIRALTLPFFPVCVLRELSLPLLHAPSIYLWGSEDSEEESPDHDPCPAPGRQQLGWISWHDRHAWELEVATVVIVTRVLMPQV